MEPLRSVSGDIPDHVLRGEAARLFPVLSETSKEGRAASVLLASLSVIDQLADTLVRRLGRPIGKRAKIKCFTEVVLRTDPKFRPDGLVIIDSGRDTWSALVECKIGKAKIDIEQLEHYLRAARDNKINCVITISNQLVADPRHPPGSVDGRLTRSIPWFHYSWLAIRSAAEMAYTQGVVGDSEKKFILAELIRFLSHPSAGIEGFTQMPEPWPHLIQEVAAGRAPKRNDPVVIEVADAWLQEEKELSLILSRLVSRRCIARSEKRLRKEGYNPWETIIGEITGRQTLMTDIAVPDAAADICIRADLRSRSTRISMTLRAPQDRKRPEARLNWLLGQLKATDANVDVGAHWPGRAKSTYGPLSGLREDPKRIIDQNIGLTPYAFEVVQTCHTPASFIGRRRFIQDLEAAIERFYSNIGRHLSAWSPKAPTPADKTAATEIEENSVIDSERVRALEQSLALVLELHGRSTNALDRVEDGPVPDGLTRSDGNPLDDS
jgi:hypothetical protein